MVAKNMNQLLKQIEKKVENALQKEVKEETVRTMEEHIQSDVYEKYTPYSSDGTTEYYERTYQLIENVKGKVEGNTLTVESGRDEDIVHVIEYGKGYSWGYRRNLDYEIGARPFIEKTRQEISMTNNHVKAMKEGLRRQGITTK